MFLILFKMSTFARWGIHASKAAVASAWGAIIHDVMTRGNIYSLLANAPPSRVDVREVTSIKAQEHTKKRHHLAAVGESVWGICCANVIGGAIYQSFAADYPISARGRSLFTWAIIATCTTYALAFGHVYGRIFTVCDNGRPVGTVRAVIPTWDYVRHGQRVESELVWSGATAMK